MALNGRFCADVPLRTYSLSIYLSLYCRPSDGGYTRGHVLHHVDREEELSWWENVRGTCPGRMFESHRNGGAVDELE